MFPKAKVKRFNEFLSCAPPVGLYDPKINETVLVPTLDTKDDRFKEPKLPLSVDSHRMVRSSSVGSRTSNSSQSTIADNLTTPKSTSNSTITTKPSDKEKALNKQLRQVVTERNSLHQKWSNKVEELAEADRVLESVIDEKLTLEGQIEALKEEVGRLELERSTKDVSNDNQSSNVDLQEENKSLAKKIEELSSTLHQERQTCINKDNELKSTQNELNDIIAPMDLKLQQLQKSLLDNLSKVEEERSKVEFLRSEFMLLDSQLEMIMSSAECRDKRMTDLLQVYKQKDGDFRQLEKSFAASDKAWESKVHDLIECNMAMSSKHEQNIMKELKKQEELIQNVNKLSIHLDEEIKLKLIAERNLELMKEEVDRLEQDLISINANMKSKLDDLVQELKEKTDFVSIQDKQIIDLKSMLREKEIKILSSEALVSSLVGENEFKIGQLNENHQAELSKQRESTLELKLELEKTKCSENLLAIKSTELTSQINKLESEHLSLKENHSSEVELKDSHIERLNKMMATSDEECERLLGIIEKLEMESKIQKLDLETELREKEDKIRDFEQQVNNDKRNFLLLEGKLNKKLTENDTTIEILTRKTKELDQTHLLYVSQIKDLEGKLSQTRESLNFKESIVSKLECEVERLMKSENETRISFELDCSSLLKQIDRLKRKLEEAELKKGELITLLGRSEEEFNLRMKEFVHRVEMSEDEKMRIMHEHLILGQEHQRVIFELKQVHALHENNTEDLLSRFEAEMKRLQTDSDSKASKLMQEREKWKAHYEDLNEKVEPFKHLLEKYELEKQVLLNKNESAQREAEKLSMKYAELMGHQNHKQKIQHVTKLKEENMQLKDIIAKLQAKDSMNRKRIEKLTGQLEALEGKRRFDPSTAFGLNRASQGGSDAEVNRRETYDLTMPFNPHRVFPSMTRKPDKIKEESSNSFFFSFDEK